MGRSRGIRQRRLRPRHRAGSHPAIRQPARPPQIPALPPSRNRPGPRSRQPLRPRLPRNPIPPAQRRTPPAIHPRQRPAPRGAPSSLRSANRRQYAGSPRPGSRHRLRRRRLRRPPQHQPRQPHLYDLFRQPPLDPKPDARPRRRGSLHRPAPNETLPRRGSQPSNALHRRRRKLAPRQTGNPLSPRPPSIRHHPASRPVGGSIRRAAAILQQPQDESG